VMDDFALMPGELVSVQQVRVDDIQRMIRLGHSVSIPPRPGAPKRERSILISR
jgi:hypothetical protein